jgi:predicted choloylglycine hydrolase
VTVPYGELAYSRTFHGITEPWPGPRWQALFRATWPGYREWYLNRDPADTPDLDVAVGMLARHMPELMPAYQRLVELAGGDEVAARMLTLWDLPRFSPGCSQLAAPWPVPMLCRNYDYSPELFEYTVMSTCYTGRRVLGTGDCLWGLLDGMNDAGLAVSLAFGGRPGSGRGFAIPLVLRFLLEVCTCTADVRAALYGMPVAMSYNLTVIDAAGSALTAHLDPDAPAEFTDLPLATNHRGHVPEFVETARSLHSVERRDALLDLNSRAPSQSDLINAFLTPPLYNSDFSRAFGTLYTALYMPTLGTVDYCWPGRTWRRRFDDPDAAVDITFREPARPGLH